uniref:Uncharacterized protein n=3 Tax=Aegilops tauschii subsp. strangulata TaxID=200361 RepID=A0A453CTI0_AEGTS
RVSCYSSTPSVPKCESFKHSTCKFWYATNIFHFPEMPSRSFTSPTRALSLWFPSHLPPSRSPPDPRRRRLLLVVVRRPLLATTTHSVSSGRAHRTVGQKLAFLGAVDQLMGGGGWIRVHQSWIRACRRRSSGAGL